ncbi:MAG: phage tail protein [Alicyclobacillus sp. RIFOXYA1_FULL_53_8]|nr:MAG: phage tail protein [Alicyclobacillus sp. RIFOXYA1_FULL_53_8]
MSDPYVGEIRMFAGNFAPVGWATCDGQSLSIADNDALFALIGTTYGGDGVNTFSLPDLRGRIPVDTSESYLLGSMAGTESITLVTQQIASHSHISQVNSNVGNSLDPSGQFIAANTYDNFSTATQGLVNMSAQAIDSTGGNQPHDNMMPAMTVTFIISLQGIYPPRN